MTVQPIYRLLCDAPYCTAGVVAEKISATPGGWTRLDSRSHLTGKPTPMVGRGRHRRALSTWDTHAAGFAITLCPEHPQVFGDHYPQTMGGEYGGRDRTRWVKVGCACDWPGGSVQDLRLVGKRPTSTVERAWLAHLPEALHWYATRPTCPDELHGADGGPCPTCGWDSHPIPVRNNPEGED